MQDNLAQKITDFEVLLGHYASRVISYPLIPPEYVYFSLTNKCNLRCKMCETFQDSLLEGVELSTDKIKDIIVQIRNMGVNHIVFSGGEPLLRNDLVEIVKFTRENNVQKIDLITNGILLDDVIMKELIESGLNHIGISIDGLSRINNSIRGTGVFEKVVSNIDKVNKYKNKHGSHFPTLGINFTVMEQNIDEMVPIVDLAREMECFSISFQPVRLHITKISTDRKGELWPCVKRIGDLRKAISELLRLKKESKVDNILIDTDVLNSLSDYFLRKKSCADFKCYEAIKRIVITCDGQVTSCQGVLGDLNKNMLSEIWYSGKAKRVRQNIKKCKRSCLRDGVCVFSNILKIVKKFTQVDFLTLSICENGLKARLIDKIDYYVGILSKNKGKDGNFFSLSCFKNTRNELIKVKKYFLENCSLVGGSGN